MAGTDLCEAQDQFIATWGQMGSAWGISRTMAEIHALLYITGQPLCTDDVMRRLQISRGNTSMSLRALVDWGIVYRTHKRGDRKEYYQADLDVWSLFRTIVRQRTKREIDPLLVSLYELRDLAIRSDDPAAIAQHHDRLDAMIEFFKIVDRLIQRFVSPKGRGLRLAANVLSRVGAG